MSKAVIKTWLVVITLYHKAFRNEGLPNNSLTTDVARLDGRMLDVAGRLIGDMLDHKLHRKLRGRQA